MIKQFLGVIFFTLLLTVSVEAHEGSIDVWPSCEFQRTIFNGQCFIWSFQQSYDDREVETGDGGGDNAGAADADNGADAGSAADAGPAGGDGGDGGDGGGGGGGGHGGGMGGGHGND